jgi:hypothetical protein
LQTTIFWLRALSAVSPAIALFSGITADVCRNAEARRFPHVLVGGRSFHDREGILALRNALTAIEWPDNELRVYATPRRPFVALSDDALFMYRQALNADGDLQIRRLHPIEMADLCPRVPGARALQPTCTGKLIEGRCVRQAKIQPSLAAWPRGDCLRTASNSCNIKTTSPQT